MLYSLHEAQHMALAPWRYLAELSRGWFGHPFSPLIYMPLAKRVSASSDLFLRITERYEKPQWNIPDAVPEVVDAEPFCNLVHFRQKHPKPRKVLVVAPLSGHHATLLRDTVRSLLPEHEVWITDWINARLVPLTAGTYTLHVKDANNCIRDTAVVVTEPTELIFDSVLVTNLKCYGVPGGEVTVHGAGGISPYMYAVNTSSFSTSRVFNGLSASTYIFHVRDSNNCVRDTAVTLAQPPRIVPAAAVKRSSCSPLNDGIITMSATGGTPGYRYALGSGSFSTNAVFSPLAAGNYVIRVRDVSNCIVDTNIVVADSLTVSANISVQDALCYDSSSGIIITLGSGGAAPYTYAIGTGTYSSLGSFGGLKANNYTIHVKDAIGCKLDTVLTIGQPTRIVPSVLATEPTCNGYSDGMFSISATGGTPVYGYSIDNGPFTSFNNIGGINAGTHIVSVLDVNGCRSDTTIVVGQPAGMKFRLEVTHLRCHGDSSGTIMIDGTGGSPPFVYTFDQQPYVPTPTLVSVSAGSHIVKMKDVKGCIKDTTVVLTEPAQLLLLNPVITNPTCEGFSDGAAKVYGNGGVQPYQFSVNGEPYSSSNNFTGLKEGGNAVRIKDANQCIYDTTLQLTGYPHIVYDEIIADPVTCFDGSDGKVSLHVSGGIQPLLYSMEQGNPGNNPVFDSLKARSYIFRVTDSAGCTKDTTVQVESPEKIQIETRVTPNDCEGYDNTGKIEAIVTGGTPGYQYTWSTTPEQYGYSIEAMANGTYRVKVTDANDCSDSVLATIEYNNCCIVFIPDAFTPNSDGLNDLARVKVKGIFTLKVFAIYNRFGERVFETKDINGGWDGVYKGTLQDLGTYNYYVKGICGDNSEEVMYKGTITLIR